MISEENIFLSLDRMQEKGFTIRDINAVSMN